jgi:hypothetical protein
MKRGIGSMTDGAVMNASQNKSGEGNIKSNLMQVYEDFLTHDKEPCEDGIRHGMPMPKCRVDNQ